MKIFRVYRDFGGDYLLAAEEVEKETAHFYFLVKQSPGLAWGCSRRVKKETASLSPALAVEKLRSLLYQKQAGLEKQVRKVTQEIHQLRDFERSFDA